MRTRDVVLGITFVLGLAACGGGGGESQGDAAATTLGPLGAPTFRTIPAVPDTVSPVPGAEADPASIIGAAPQTYTIVEGDYPGLLGTKFGCPWEELAAFNEILPEDFMDKKGYPGEVLNLPPVCTDEQTEGDPIAAAATETAAGATATTEPEVVEGSEYEIKSGDTVSGIASNFGITMNQLVEANGWTDGINHRIDPGDKIKLPAPPAP